MWNFITVQTMNIIIFSDDDAATADKKIFCFKKHDSRYRHCKKILHLQKDDTFKAAVLNGDVGYAHIVKFDSESLEFTFSATATPLPLFPIDIVLGFPRPIQLKRCLKDLSTLGVRSIHLVPTELGEASYYQSSLVQKNEITTYLVEGACQAGTSRIPTVHTYKRFLDCPFFNTSDQKTDATDIPTNELKIVLDITENSSPLAKTLTDKKLESLVLIVGNERGWTVNERTFFTKRNFLSCSLGSRILKTETACITATAISLSALGFW